MCLYPIESHTWRGMTPDIWVRAECGNTIPDRSKGQLIQLRDAREWRNKVAHGGVGGAGDAGLY